MVLCVQCTLGILQQEEASDHLEDSSQEAVFNQRLEG